jgi:hypothetical protein
MSVATDKRYEPAAHRCTSQVGRERPTLSAIASRWLGGDGAAERAVNCRLEDKRRYLAKRRERQRVKHGPRLERSRRHVGGFPCKSAIGIR